MNTEQVLREALAARAATAAPDPAALAEFRRRAGRRRWTARLQVVTAGAAAAGVVALSVVALVRIPEQPVPRTPDVREPVTSGPATSPSATSPSATAPSATASPGTAGALREDEYVALLRDGRLVAASATTGEITRTLLAGATAPRAYVERFDHTEGVAIAPDRRTVYLATGDAATPCEQRALDRVDVATGERTRVAAGSSPDVSPDGTRLAYLAPCPGRAGVVVRDLRTGTERRFAHTELGRDADGNPRPWTLDRALWQPDGRRLWVVLRWEDSTELRVLDPADDRTTDHARPVRTRHTTLGLERHGDGLAYVHGCCYADEHGEDLLVRRAADGTERVLVRAPDTDALGRLAAGPDGALLYERRGRLHRLDVTTGTSTDLGPATAIARDW